MADHEAPYCHGQPMGQVAVNYTSPLSYQYRCATCGRSHFIQDTPKPRPATTLEEFAADRGKTVEELLAESERLRPKP